MGGVRDRRGCGWRGSEDVLMGGELGRESHLVG